MARLSGLFLLAFIAAASIQCRPAAKEYSLRGQIVGINRSTRELTVRHEDIPGLMPAMVMSFKVADPAEIDRRKPGELITATLVVRDVDTELRNITVTGTAPLDAAVARNATTPVLQPGDPVPEGDFQDEEGRARHLSEWRGSVVLLTFIYTRCPLPDFCPRLERHFLALQRQLDTARLRDHARLVAVSFDPTHDTPPVLKKHAARVGADPALWRYLTGDLATIERFAAQFGVSIIRNPSDSRDITHNLRTALIGPDGRLLEIYSGADWTPEEALAAIRRAYPAGT